MIVKRISKAPKYRYGGSSYSIHRSKYRYGGSGIFTNLIGRKLLEGNTVKNLINSISKSKITQKAASAVVDGATNAVKEQTQKGVEGVINIIKKRPKGGNKQKREHRDIVNRLTQDFASTIPTTSSIEGIIRGKGIVYD